MKFPFYVEIVSNYEQKYYAMLSLYKKCEGCKTSFFMVEQVFTKGMSKWKHLVEGIMKYMKVENSSIDVDH